MTEPLIPPQLSAAVAKLPAPFRAAPSPLPESAVKWYISGGCWSLALALHDATRLPIEVYYLGGRPKHAYVVDGDAALDARGRSELRLVRVGAERTEEVLSKAALVDALLPFVPQIEVLLNDPEVRAAGSRAGAIVLGS